MSTPEQPNTPSLTRRQLREIRNTGATPVIGVGTQQAPEVDEDTFVVSQSAAAGPGDPPGQAAVPMPRAALPVAVAPAPVPDASVDLGVNPLTRRQARQQERIRTASVPVITPDFAAQLAEASTPGVDAAGTVTAEIVDEPVEDAPVDATPVAADEPSGISDDDPLALILTDDDDDQDAGERPVVDPGFGAELLAGEPTRVELPPTFDQLISRDTSSAGSVATPNALILSQTPSAGPLTGPIAATGEVLITGSYDLPEGLGSTGHAPGVADGKEADAVLVDGELPAHSSPTPIAASAAISTVKTDGEIIRPPAPEKGSKLMLALAITAGALAFALVGVLILAWVTGVFS